MMHNNCYTRKLAALCFLVVIVGCDSSDTSLVASDSVNTISWESCDAESVLQCATVSVPKNHDDPEGEQITVALNRIESAGTAPLGSLLFNPGGPGGSGIGLIEDINEISAIPNSVRESYHLVGFDPRGIGKSTPVDCTEFGIDDLEGYLPDFTAVQENHRQLASIATACFDKHGDYLQHIGSRAVVKDMEMIRIALGEDKLNFIGYSYGTRLAGLYIQDYPDKTGRMILDGSLPPTHGVADLFGGELTVLESNFSLLAESCKLFGDCDPQAYKQDIESHIASLVENDSELEAILLFELVFGLVESPDSPAELYEALFVYMQDKDLDILTQAALQFVDDDEEDEDSITAAIAVICADDPQRLSAEEIEALRQPYNAASDLFAEIRLADASYCAGWPESLDPLPVISTTQAPETLVIGGPTDAQTILPWSEEMAGAIGGRFLTSNHQGHTTVFTGRNSCTDRVAVDYLINGVLPDQAVCPAD